MKKVRCAIYTRKSSEEGLDQDFNSLDAQREACSAYVASQKHEGWVLLPTTYDDGGLSGGNMNRPALQSLLADIDASLVDQIVVYKIDRLTRSLTDFARLVDRLDRHDASFVSVTQSFNTATSVGRLTLNVLLSFAQFEREVTAERIRDKIAASKKKGMWMGGAVPLGYRPNGRTLQIHDREASIIRQLYELYLEHGSVAAVKNHADRLLFTTRKRVTKAGKSFGGKPFDPSHLHAILTNPLYCGNIRHKTQIHQGLHPAIVDQATWEKVQQQLAGKAPYQRGTATRATAPSPLMGKLFDEAGQRLVPSHARKQGKHYRYYVSAGLIKPGLKDGWRLPAADLEASLYAAVVRLLKRAGAIGILDGAAPDVARIDQVDHRLAEMQIESAIPANTLHLLKRCTLQPGQITIELDVEALATHFGIGPSDISSDIHKIIVPFTRRKRGVEARLIIRTHEGQGQASSQGTQTSKDTILIKNIQAANRWYRAAQKGQSFAEIAANENTSSNTVQRVISLAFLAPDIVRDILQGEQPTALTSDWLLRQTLPSDFQDQRDLINSLR
ncbi:recombinase family protein [Roseibium algae]|uniref:Recombinase family protein n=1 Tax=Roseibium algae TaxID=3123038 RepID=A0ABU8TGB7_9HYPH